MNEPAPYSLFHPRWHRRRVSTYWWLERAPYLLFIMREVSSVFVAWSIAFMLALLRAVAQGPEAYLQYQKWAAAPVLIVVNAVALFFLVVHAITWFNLAPKAIVLRMNHQRVPAWCITASNYAAWLVASIIVGWIILSD